MKGTQAVRRIVISDACVLINFLHVDRLDLLLESAAFEVVITDHVRGEVLEDTQREKLDRAVEGRKLLEVQITDPVELSLFASLSGFLGNGEAAALAVAERRGWMIATDERGRTLTEIVKRLGSERLRTTPAIIVQCIRSGAISVPQADAIKERLEALRFRMPFRSFADLA